MKQELPRLMTRVLPITMTLCLLCGCLAKAQVKSDRERDELYGPVRFIRTEKSLLSKSGDKSPEKITEITQVTYDISGNRTEETKFKADGSLTSKSTFDYDGKGNRTAETMFNPDGSVYLKEIFSQRTAAAGTRIEDSTITNGANPPTKTTRIYDNKGQPTELIALGPDGKTKMRTVTVYRDDGKPSELDFYQDSDKQDGKMLLVYDTQGNLAEEQEYGADGSLASKTVFGGDTERGSDITATEYDSKGGLVGKEHYVREYDSHGNWTRETKSKLNLESRNWEITETTQRQITYN